MAYRLATLSMLLAYAYALADPMVTAAAQLAPRADDPALVGYISASGGFKDARSCDFPQTVSTSGNYVQCCPTTGACPFYTSCSSNTLLAASATVPCDVDPALTCNTGIVAPSTGAAGGASYLACWQTSLGSNPFTFVRNIGSATVVAPSTTGTGSASNTESTSRSSASSSAGSSTSRATSTSSRSSSAGAGSSSAGAASTSASSSTNIAGVVTGTSGGVVGLLAFLAQWII
ncbi:hypothetical protein CAC42_4681 [Sphaceloma murrayae]|uniref:Uncharacterized protein n=1 Tax=Sphaceloma murrayae TaxID=2082308 RepID=A0A2K1QNL0_9PEZI|nr:hypothetical protein CAC42_4681 [Sphaceloma murrayae]